MILYPLRMEHWAFALEFFTFLLDVISNGSIAGNVSWIFPLLLVDLQKGVEDLKLTCQQKDPV